jgi:2-keto-4-pentenoate hydratase
VSIEPAAPSGDLIQQLANQLWVAQARRVPIGPLTRAYPLLRIEDAYAIQTWNVQRRIAAGGKVIGHKLGLTSTVVQELLGVHEPTFGVLFDDMLVGNGTQTSHQALLQPRAEAEIAFRMGRDLTGPGVGTAEALAAVDGVIPAIEIGDSRIGGWRVQIADTVADNASSGRLVLGDTVTPAGDLDLRLLGMLFHRNDVPIDSGAGAAVLGHPARAVAWLANRLGTFGTGLRAGDIVLSGALHRMVPVRPGDVIRADFAHLGSVSVRFSEGG